MTTQTKTNSAAGHTPGPWEIRQITKSWAVIAPVGKDARSVVCHFGNGIPLCNQDLANAALIAEAPDLLKQLKNTLAVVLNLTAGGKRNSFVQMSIDAAQSAIAKAEKEVN